MVADPRSRLILCSKGFAVLSESGYSLFLRFRDRTIRMRTLWLVIVIKLVVIFVVLRLLFFAPATGGMDDSERASAVMERMTENIE